MSFIRTKKVKDYIYAYIVDNKWKSGKVKQKVKKYLGRVYDFKRNERDFYDYFQEDILDYVEKHTNKEIVVMLVEWELGNLGFKKLDKVYENEECIFDPKTIRFYNKRKADIALKCNEGLISDFTVRRLIRLNVKGDEEEVMYKFAKLFVEAGINVPKDMFIALYSKVFK